VLTACRGTSEEPVVVVEPPPKLALEGFEDWARWVPADAIVLGVGDGRATTELLTLAMPPERPSNTEARARHIAELERDAGRAVQGLLGVDLTGVERIAVAAGLTWQAVLVFGEAPMLFGDDPRAVGELVARPLVTTSVPMGPSMAWGVQVSEDPALHVIFPSDEVFEAYLADPKSLADAPERLRAFEALWARAPALGYGVAALLDDASVRADFEEAASFEAPDGVIAALGEDMVVTMVGSEGALDGVRAAYEQGVAMMGAEVQAMHDRTAESEDPSLLYVLIVMHTVSAWKDSIIVTRPNPGTLSFRAPDPFEGPLGIAALAGIVSVLIPFDAFMGGVVDEPKVVLPDDDVYAGTRAEPAAAIEYMPEIMTQIGKHYRRGASCTPPPDSEPFAGGVEACCALDGATPQCDASAEVWSGPGWRDIGFAPPENHRFVYTMQTRDIGYGEFETVLRARTLDACGAPDTEELFEVVVYATPGDGGCDVSNGTPLYIWSEESMCPACLVVHLTAEHTDRTERRR